MLPVPFTNMAISLSGGGYRATTFHLGALCYLDATKHGDHSLLEHVKIVSTISGGTLTGVMYAWKMSQGEGFIGCFTRLYELLEEDNLVDEALHKLNYPHRWANKHKTRDIINSFAEVYNERFYNQATFANLYDGEQTHLHEAIFGSSEFTYGLQFRFQEQGRFGNHELVIPKEAAREIPLADAAAASSCFPGGFEPMIMPHDFSNGPGSLLEKEWEHQKTAIMDGGIIDNQGIEGVKLSEKRHANRDKKPFIGTYIISDVSSKIMTPYKVPKFKYNRFKNFLTLNGINIFAAVLLAILIAALIFANLSEIAVIITSCILTIAALWFIIFIFIRSFIRKKIASTFGPEQAPELIKDFGVMLRTPLYIIYYFIKFRLTSVSQMVSDIFLRRIRQLQLKALFTHPKWNYRIITNNIYTLEDDKEHDEDGERKKDLKEEELPERMKTVIDSANTMPTTLWFTEKDKKSRRMDNLIACGQFTLCKNLIEYIDQIQTKDNREDVWTDLPKDTKTSIIELKKRMEADWEKFKADPYWMVDDFKKRMNQIA